MCVPRLGARDMKENRADPRSPPHGACSLADLKPTERPQHGTYTVHCYFTQCTVILNFPGEFQTCSARTLWNTVLKRLTIGFLETAVLRSSGMIPVCWLDHRLHCTTPRNPAIQQAVGSQSLFNGYKIQSEDFFFLPITLKKFSNPFSGRKRFLFTQNLPIGHIIALQGASTEYTDAKIY